MLKSNIEFSIKLESNKIGEDYELKFWRNINGKVEIQVKGKEFLAVSVEGETPADILKMALLLQ